MSYPELLEAIRQLPRPDKIRLMHELMDDVPAASEAMLLESLGVAPGGRYEVWFPDANSAGTAGALQALLEQQGKM